ncbi:YqfQ family protein [Peribacillus asahii]|uniref:YqfQ family protein n=1 Tax=Peribacillus asahii TaxID=228899 RepID=UPI00207AD904|nr:YqfQ family protein [Peribacillus asahii]USK58826.1 YqfQ family protein [Peribacillus asahii]
MIQGRYPGPGPNFPPSNRRNMYPPSDFQRGMPTPSRPNPFFQKAPQQPHINQPRANAPFHQQDMMQQRPKKEGLLGRLLGKSKQKAAPQNLFAPPSQGKQDTRSNNSGGGIMETLRNPEGITSMLNNTQKVLQAAEQFTPIVQQYGPMIKNLPSMWNIIRAFSSNDNDKKEEPKQEENISKETVTEIPTEESPKSSTEQTAQQKTDKKPKPKKKKTSGPKLYI